MRDRNIKITSDRHQQSTLISIIFLKDKIIQNHHLQVLAGSFCVLPSLEKENLVIDWNQTGILDNIQQKRFKSLLKYHHQLPLKL